MGRWTLVVRHKEPAIRFFASSHQLHQLAPRTLILCALFLTGVLLQGVSGVLMHHHGAGWTPTSVATYYRGDQGAPPTDDTALQAMFATGEPGAPVAPPRVARSFGTLLEVAHFHLVAMPLMLFIVAHLFSMAPFGRARWAGAICYVGFACAFADILAPFAVRYVGDAWAPLWAWTKLIAFLGLATCFLGMTLATLVAGMVALARVRRAGPTERSA